MTKLEFDAAVFHAERGIAEFSLESTLLKRHRLLSGVCTTASAAQRIEVRGDVIIVRVQLTLATDLGPELAAATVGALSEQSFEIRTWRVDRGELRPATRFGAIVHWQALGRVP